MDTNCASCEATISVREDAYPGEIVECMDCNIELEILGVRPIAIGVAPEPDEDWGE